MTSFDWTPIRYRNVIAVLKNRFAGAYAYGKSETRLAIVDGRARKTYGHGKPLEAWEVLLKDHHEGYIDWATSRRNRAQLAAAYGKRRPEVEAAASARCSPAFSLAGAAAGAWRCPTPAGRQERGLSLRQAGIDAGIAALPDVRQRPRRCCHRRGVDARARADGDRGGAGGRRSTWRPSERRRAAELDLQQARYEASLAERYAACDPDNRLIAAQLERSWETALRHGGLCRTARGV